MPLWGKEDKPSARPKSIQLKPDGTLAQDASGKKLVYLSKEEAQANANKGASGAGWYTILTTNGTFAASERVFSVALHSDSGSAVNNVQFVVETLGINTTTVKADIELRLDASDNIEDSSGLS